MPLVPVHPLYRDRQRYLEHILIIAGWWLGDNWEEVGKVIDYLEYPIYLAIVLAVIWFFWKRKFSPAARSAKPDNV